VSENPSACIDKHRPLRWLLVHYAIIWLTYTSILVVVAAWHFGEESVLDISPGVITLFSTNQEIQKAYGEKDLVHFAAGGLMLYEDHGFTSGWMKYTLWPLGMYLLHLTLLILLGVQGPVVLGLILFTSGVWGGVMTALYSFFRRNISSYISFLVPFVFFGFSIFRVYFLGDGLLSSEPIAIGLFCLAISFLFVGVSLKKKQYSILAGIVFGLACIFRLQCVTVILSGAGLLAIWVFIGWLSKFLKVKYNIHLVFNSAKDIKIHLCIGVGIAIVFVVTGDYWYKYKYTATVWDRSGWYYEFMWKKIDELGPNKDLLFKLGVPAPCYVDFNLCQEIARRKSNKEDVFKDLSGPPLWEYYKKMTFTTMAKNPLKWLFFRFERLPASWFSKVAYSEPNGPEYFDNSLYILLALAGVILLFFVSGTDGVFLIWLTATHYFGFFLMFLMLHQEVRYLFMLKMSLVFTFLLTLSVVLPKINPSK